MRRNIYLPDEGLCQSTRFQIVCGPKYFIYDLKTIENYVLFEDFMEQLSKLL